MTVYCPHKEKLLKETKEVKPRKVKVQQNHGDCHQTLKGLLWGREIKSAKLGSRGRRTVK